METLQLVLRSAGGLLAVLGTVWLLARWARARGGTAAVPGLRLRVLARASVGRRASVVTVDAGDRVLVLGVTDGAVRLLAEQPALPTAESAVERTDVTDLTDLADPTHLADRAVVPLASATAVPAPRTGSPLAGSLLDPGVWRGVVQVARDRTVRR